jgi:hypothetical protein
MTQFGRGSIFEGKHYDGFPSLAEMMRFLQRNGLNVILWMTPFLNTVSKHDEVPGQLERAANHDEGAERGLFGPVDFTNLPLPIHQGTDKGGPPADARTRPRLAVQNLARYRARALAIGWLVLAS